MESFAAGLGVQLEGGGGAPERYEIGSQRERARGSGQQQEVPPFPVPSSSAAEPVKQKKLDEFGRRLPDRNLYVLLTSKPGGGKPGFYRGSWEQFCAAANPEDRVLPAKGFSYRKPESLEKAREEWKDWGWEDEPEQFSL